MIQNVNPVSEHFLNALSQLQKRLNDVQRQLSSGLRIERASDAPDRVYDVIYRQSQIQHSNQIFKNLARVQATVNAADASLFQAVSVLEEAIVTGTQALNINLDADSSAALVEEARSHHESLVRLSLTTTEGRFVFGGDQNEQAPYQLNTANPNGVDRLTTSPATKLVLDFDGSRFLAGRTAQEIFDHREADDSLSQDNAFAAVQGLRTAIEAGDTAAITASMEKLHAAHAYLNRQFSFYGSVQTRITESINRVQQAEVRMKSELSDIRDTDVAAAAVQLTQIQTSIEAALRAQGSTAAAPNLFDYLR
jgi:flagellar hook-associated protein 3 FlgL